MKILKITSILLLLITIFCILFLRIVPDYSNKYGFEIVSLNDYNKYKQGYCLKEDRILSKNELYKRAVKNYFLIIKKDAQNPKYWNIMQEKYSYNYYCYNNDFCSFYMFDFTDLNDYNIFMKTIKKIDEFDFVKLYGKKIDLKNIEIFNESGNLKISIGFDNGKYHYFSLYLPKSFEIISIDDMKKSKTLLKNNPHKKFPNIISEYSKYYLKFRFIFTNDLMPNFVIQPVTLNIPITKCGDINIKDIYYQKSDNMSHTFYGS